MKFQKKPWKHDPRSDNFSHERFFATPDISTLPSTLGRPLLKPEDQLYTQRCAAYAGSKNGEFIHGVRMSPEWQAKQIGEIQGKAVDIEGSDPNAAMKSQTFRDGGYLPYDHSPVTLEKDGLSQSVDPFFFSEPLDEEAKRYGNAGFVKPSGGKDIFDSIKLTLYTQYDPLKKCGPCVQAFGRWYNEWMSTVIPDTYVSMAGFHSWLFVDWIIEEDGTEYLLGLNSYGERVGYQSFTRATVNREFSRGNTSLKIPVPLTPEQIALAKEETPFGFLQRQINDLWYFISTRFLNV